MTALVHPDRLFGVVQRLFTGSVEEVLGELLQNAQRSGATEVDIRIDQDRMVFSDNGTGLKKGLEGFRTLLAIADSNYRPEVEATQSPMGVGFYALLSHPGISQVDIQSGGRAMAIDTARWFSDSQYRNAWKDLVFKTEYRPGTVIEAKGSAELLESLLEHLEPVGWQPASPRGFPAWGGYMEHFRMTVNGRALPTELPESMQLNVLFETDYAGNRIRVGMAKKGLHFVSNSFVNWFGYLIKVPGIGQGIDWQITVTTGSPVTPRSPTRDGIVEDEKWALLTRFVCDQTRAYFEQLETPPALEVLRAGFRLFPELTQQLPWVIARKAEPGSHPGYKYRFEETPDVVIDKAGDHYLLDTEIELYEGSEPMGSMEGLESFLPLLDKPAYFLRSSRVPVTGVAWKPGPLVRNDVGVEIRGRGHFAVLDESGEPQAWIPVSRDVFAYNQPHSHDVTLCYLMIGTESPVEAIRLAAKSTFEYHPDIEDSWATADQAFTRTVEAVIRKIVGNVVPRDFSKNDLAEFVPKGKRIKRIEFGYEKGKLTNLTLVLNKGKAISLGLI